MLFEHMIDLNLNFVQIESANNKIECLQKQNECVKRQNDTLMLNIRDLQNHVKHFEETCFCRYRVNEVIAIDFDFQGTIFSYVICLLRFSDEIIE